VINVIHNDRRNMKSEQQHDLNLSHGTLVIMNQGVRFHKVFARWVP
jgi:hypothetical protein